MIISDHNPGLVSECKLNHIENARCAFHMSKNIKRARNVVVPGDIQVCAALDNSNDINIHLDL